MLAAHCHPACSPECSEFEHVLTNDDPPGVAVFKIVFEASGCVGKGEGPDALDVPEQENDQ